MDEKPDATLTDRTVSRKLRFATYSPVVSLGVLVACVLALVALLFWAMRWVDHTNRVIEQAWYVQKLALDLQTSTRGYLLTGDPLLLHTFDASDDELPRALADLRIIVQDNDRQRGRVDRINREMEQWLTWVGGIFRASDPRAGVKPTTQALQDGNAIFSSVRDDLSRFIAEENVLRRERSERVRRFTRFALIVGVIVSVGVAVWQCRAMRRRIVEVSQTYREALRLAKERRDRIRELLKRLDQELQAVGEIQRSLLPVELPKVIGLDLAASYQTSSRAGGDYFDFFPLPPIAAGGPNRLGILIADVSGHGTPAAVLMAVTHSIAHGFDEPNQPPSDLLAFVNHRLCESYTTSTVAFVTAFYGIYDPATRILTYSSAGHNPPRLHRQGRVWRELEDAQGLPLGVMSDATYLSRSIILRPDDTLVIYTDGITEARDAAGAFFGVEGLDAALAGETGPAQDLLDRLLTRLKLFANQSVLDDQTLLVLRVLEAPQAHVEPRHSRILPASPITLPA